MCCELVCWLFGCLLDNALYPVMNMMEVLSLLYDVLWAISKIGVKLCLNNVHITLEVFWIAW